MCLQTCIMTLCNLKYFQYIRCNFGKTCVGNCMILVCAVLFYSHTLQLCRIISKFNCTYHHLHLYIHVLNKLISDSQGFLNLRWQNSLKQKYFLILSLSKLYKLRRIYQRFSQRGFDELVN